MKKIYFLLFCFLFTGNVFASSYWLSIVNGKRNISARELKATLDYFESCRDKINDKTIEELVYVRKKLRENPRTEKENDSSIRLCSAAYYCSDNEIREIFEEELGKDDLSIRIARYVLKAVGKEVIEEKLQ